MIAIVVLSPACGGETERGLALREIASLQFLLLTLFPLPNSPPQAGREQIVSVATPHHVSTRPVVEPLAEESLRPCGSAR